MRQYRRLRRKISVWMFTAFLGIFGIQQAHAGSITLYAGAPPDLSTATFAFDFSPTDLSSANTIRYDWTLTDPYGFDLVFWSGDIALFDELGEPAYSSSVDGPYSILYSMSFSRPLDPQLFDDPKSYVTVTFDGAQRVGPIPPEIEVLIASQDLIEMSMFATARFDDGDISVEGHVIPEPATIVLLTLGLAGIGLRRHLGG